MKTAFNKIPLNEHFYDPVLDQRMVKVDHGVAQRAEYCGPMFENVKRVYYGPLVQVESLEKT